MKNRNVYLKKLKLPAEYIDDPKIVAVLSKAGTLSKQEKQWLLFYTDILKLKQPKVVDNTKLSIAFINHLKGI